ncbi:MAG: hypothetical protein ABI954_00475 [Pyrinomonadaceae bacterium]
MATFVLLGIMMRNETGENLSIIERLYIGTFWSTLVKTTKGTLIKFKQLPVENMTRVWLLVFVVFLFVFSVPAQSLQPKTVTDFYLAMSSDNYSHPFGREISSTAAITKYRKSLIKIEDIKNGYLRLEPNESEGWSEIALFKKTDGSYLIAHSNVGCGPGCQSDLELLTFKNGNWTNVTKQFFPPLSKDAKEAESCRWKLPRFGRILTMECGNDEDENQENKEFAFEWNGTEFIVNSQTSDENLWIGKYEREDGGGKVLNQLVVKSEGNKLTAVYRAVVTAQLVMYFSLNVEIKGNTAFFYYDRCLPKKGDPDFDGYDPYPCSEDTYKRGDLMFKLVKSVDKNKKVSIRTYGVKLDEMNHADNLFFERVKIF